MAKKEKIAKNKKRLPFAVLRKGALCALLGATVLAGGLLVGCDADGSVSVPAGTEIYWGTEDPNTTDNPGKVGDYYIETDDGDIWQLSAEGWKAIPNFNIKGPQGAPGRTPTIEISNDGYWIINGVKSEVKAEGDDGEDAVAPTVEITADGYWEISGVKSDVKAEGVNGKSAYELAIDNQTFQGTVAEWLESLKGKDGKQGAQGYYVTSVKEVVDDAWGISSHFEFTLNDEANTVVSTESVSRLMPNYYYGATTGADVLKLISLGAENIQIENDIDVTEAIVLEGNLSIDLNNHKLTYSNGTQIVVDNGIELEFKDGEMEFEAKSCTTSSIKVQGGASLVLDRVEYVSAGTNVMVIENATSVKVVDSHLTGAVYCVGTNALTEENFGVKIEIDDCEFDTTGYEYLGETWYDTTPILINIPCTATIKDSKITGHRQAVIVRGGDVTIENCTLISTGKDVSLNGLGFAYNTSDAWGTGNAVAIAALTVGNDGTGIYKNYSTNLTLTDVEIKSQKASIPAIYAIGNEGENLGVNLLINTNLEEKIPTTIIANDYVNLAFMVDSAKDLFNVAKEVMEDRNIVIVNKDGFAPSIILTQDINEDIYLSTEEYCKYGFMTQLFTNFIQNTEEYEYNVNYYAKVGNAMEVAFLLESLNEDPGQPFMLLQNNIDLAEVYKMMGDTNITMEDVAMVSMLNEYVVRSGDGYAISDYYTISCSLPVEVASADEVVEAIMQAIETGNMPTLILTSKVEFNDILTSLNESIMNGVESMSNDENVENEMSTPPSYYTMPTVDTYLEIKALCTADTRDNLVWAEGNEMVSVASYDALDYAVNSTEATNVMLFNNIDCKTAIEVSREVTIDLNYCGISVLQDPNGDGVFYISEGGHLIINGEGTLNGVGNNIWNIVIFANGGDVTINGGTYTNIGAIDPGPDGLHFDVIYASKGSTVTINGGTFEGQTPNWLLNIKDSYRDTTSIVVKGGLFKGFNPANCATEGEKTNFVAEGYEVIELPQENGEIWYQVVQSTIAK